MGPGFEVTGLAGWVLLALPIVLLVAVIVRTTCRMRAPYVPPYEDTALVDQPTTTFVPPTAARDTAIQNSREADAAKSVASRAAATATQTDIDIVAGIERAEMDGEEEALPSLYLTLAKLKAADGQAREAAQLLRKCIMIASRLALYQPHAEARLELGDLAFRAGDLTTACEHWQLARGLFRQLDQWDALGGVETRMRDNGCPTDWVLNDF